MTFKNACIIQEPVCSATLKTTKSEKKVNSVVNISNHWRAFSWILWLIFLIESSHVSYFLYNFLWNFSWLRVSISSLSLKIKRSLQEFQFYSGIGVGEGSFQMSVCRPNKKQTDLHKSDIFNLRPSTKKCSFFFK